MHLFGNGQSASQIWMVVECLGPIYALAFGIIGAQKVVDIVMRHIFPNSYKKKSGGTNKTTAKGKAKRPRTSAFYSSKQHPGLRYNKSRKGLKVSWYADAK